MSQPHASNISAEALHDGSVAKIEASRHSEVSLGIGVSAIGAAPVLIEGLAVDDNVQPIGYAFLTDSQRDLAERNIGLARHLAFQASTSYGLPRDELIGEALLALSSNAGSFDPDRGIPFERYAAPRIANVLKRAHRDKGDVVKKPRSLSDNYTGVRYAIEDLEQGLGGCPSPAQIAKHSGIPLEHVTEYFTHSIPESLDGPSGSDGSGVESLPVSDRVGGEDANIKAAELTTLIDGLVGTGELSERDKRILTLRFWEDLSQAEIARKVGISQMHVSRTLKRVLGELKLALEPTDA